MAIKRSGSRLSQIKAKYDAMKEAGTVCFFECRRGNHFVLLVPVWRSGYKYYRQVAWTPFHERAGLGVMGNTYYSADLGLRSILASARSEIGEAMGQS